MSGTQRILQPGGIEALDRVSFPRVRLPQPATLFQERAARLRQLAQGHPIGDYLRFAARLVEAQQRVAAALPQAESPTAAVLAQAQAAGMPLYQPAQDLPADWRDALRAIVADLRDAGPGGGDVPRALRPVLQGLAASDDAALDALARQALADNLGREDLAAAPVAMAALQVAFARRADVLQEADVPLVTPATLCPVCGCLPVASVLRIGGQAGGHRYLHCGLGAATRRRAARHWPRRRPPCP